MYLKYLISFLRLARHVNTRLKPINLISTQHFYHHITNWTELYLSLKKRHFIIFHSSLFSNIVHNICLWEKVQYVYILYEHIIISSQGPWDPYPLIPRCSPIYNIWKTYNALKTNTSSNFRIFQSWFLYQMVTQNTLWTRQGKQFFLSDWRLFSI